MKSIAAILLGARTCLLFLLIDSAAHAFVPASGGIVYPHYNHACHRPTPLFSSEVATAGTTDSGSNARQIIIDPKEAVKLFGRLAEKYISEFLLLKRVVLIFVL